MNMTQKQLAVLAHVSAPTISRFEQNAKDIQLSSVLAVLDVLGMTDRRVVTFDDDPPRTVEIYEDRERRIMSGDGNGQLFWGRDGDKKVKFIIQDIAIDDHFSDGDKLGVMAGFKKHRPEIEAIARRKYLLGQIEPDGSVLIRTEDLLL